MTLAFCLSCPSGLLLASTAVLYHVNCWLQRAYRLALVPDCKLQLRACVVVCHGFVTR